MGCAFDSVADDVVFTRCRWSFQKDQIVANVSCICKHAGIVVCFNRILLLNVDAFMQSREHRLMMMPSCSREITEMGTSELTVAPQSDFHKVACAFSCIISEPLPSARWRCSGSCVPVGAFVGSVDCAIYRWQEQ